MKVKVNFRMAVIDYNEIVIHCRSFKNIINVL